MAMDIHDLFWSVDRANDYGLMTGPKQVGFYEKRLSDILFEPLERIEFCLYLIESFDVPQRKLDELLDAAEEVISEEKTLDDMADEQGVPLRIATQAVEEAKALMNDEEGDE